MNHKSTLLLLAVVFISFTLPLTASENVLFIGLSGDNSPAISTTLEKHFRGQMSVAPEIELFDYVETRRYRERIEFNRYPSVSAKMIADLEKFVPDSILIMWGSIKNLRIEPSRTKLIMAMVRGELTVTVMVYNLIRKSFSYRINVTGSAQMAKGWIFFSDPGKTVAVSASERTKLIEQCIDNAAEKLTSIIASIVRNEKLRGPTAPASEEGEINKLPSISDVFTLPSVQAAEIQNNTFDSETESEFSEETITSESEEPVAAESNDSAAPEPEKTESPEREEAVDPETGESGED